MPPKRYRRPCLTAMVAPNRGLGTVGASVDLEALGVSESLVVSPTVLVMVKAPSSTVTVEG